TLRDMPHDTLPPIKASMERLVTEGVPNRFGPQRFGNKNDSHLIGKALVKAEWETVLHYMLTEDALQMDNVARRMQQELARKPIEKVITSI
ncbi:MAG: tRNA pseudouridine(13) synthase TruD, partial [Candidatus Poribacteria bacterium]|nr:tRNA pseudouridine(13) synthase TruD [Candidatus Poribacteria bacterium]